MDNFFSNYFAIRRESKGVGKPATCGDAAQTSVKGASFSNNVVQVTSQTAALSVSAFFRGVELRANTMSMLVMEYQKKNDSTHGGNYELDTAMGGRYLNYLLQVQPNPTMTWPQMIKQAEQQRIYQGNAVIYIERDTAGEIKFFWLCSSAKLDTNKYVYNIEYNAPGGKIRLNGVAAREVLHIRNTFSNDNGLTGVGTLRYMQQTLSTAATNDRQAQENAGKGGRMKILVQENKVKDFGVGRVKKDQLEKITNELNQKIWEQDVNLLNNVADVKVISQNAQQMELLESRKFDVPCIARFLGVPLSMLMHSANETYKTPEAATQEFLLRTIQPLSHDWEVEMTSKLLGIEGYPQHRYHFNEESLMRLDPAGRANIGKTLLETGVKCVNELRAEYDLPSVEGGDRHFISTNLQPVDAPVVTGASVDTEGTGAKKGGEA